MSSALWEKPRDKLNFHQLGLKPANKKLMETLFLERNTSAGKRIAQLSNEIRSITLRKTKVILVWLGKQTHGATSDAGLITARIEFLTSHHSTPPQLNHRITRLSTSDSQKKMICNGKYSNGKSFKMNK